MYLHDVTFQQYQARLFIGAPLVGKRLNASFPEDPEGICGFAVQPPDGFAQRRLKQAGVSVSEKHMIQVPHVNKGAYILFARGAVKFWLQSHRWDPPPFSKR